MCDILFEFSLDSDENPIIIFYRDFWGRINSRTNWVTEGTIISISSHEAIEVLIREIKPPTFFGIADIHQIIGGNYSHYKKKIKAEDYIGNTDGLPNLEL